MQLPRLARTQTSALVRAFLLRFFESEITSSADDLKTTFFWLLAFLAVPGLVIPVDLSFIWTLRATLEGVEGLRIASRGEKAFYLGFAMMASGTLSVIAWGSLLVDRRDGLILGALPVRPRVVLGSKLLALGAYIAIVSVAMHALASVSFGFFLASRGSLGFAIRGIVAHFIASCLASALVLLGVVAMQGSALALLGPRRYGRLSPILQSLVVCGIAATCLILPLIDVSTVQTLAGHGPGSLPWLLETPPLWFLGVYEVLLGSAPADLVALAARAALWLAVAVAGVAVTYPLAFGRVMESAVSDAGGSEGLRIGSRLSAGIARAVSWRPQTRAVVQFLLASLGRSERHRFIVAASIGLTVAWAFPTWAGVVTAPPLQPTGTVLGVSLSAMLFLVSGFRVAIGVPSDISAGWLMDLAPPPAADLHAGLERALIGLVVLPIVLAGAPVYAWLWGPRVAAMHALISLLIGVLLIEVSLGGVRAMPCARRWDPEILNLGKRWYVYLASFLVIARGVPAIEILAFDSWSWVGTIAAGLAAAALVVRWRTRRRAEIPVLEIDAAEVELLGLN